MVRAQPCRVRRRVTERAFKRAVCERALHGQYMAPVGEYIFPENTIPGAPTTTYTFWQLDFLRSGEGGDAANAGLAPQPW